MNNQAYINAFLNKWWVIVVAVLICAGLGLAYSFSQEKVYRSTATFVANPALEETERQALLTSINTLAQRTSLVNTFCEILKSETIFQKAATSLEIEPKLATHYQTNCVVLPDSNVLWLEVDGPSPKLSAALANAVGTAGLTYIQSLNDIFEIRPLDTAIRPTKPISPDHVTNIGLSIIVGVIVGVTFIFLQQTILIVLKDKEEEKPALSPSPVPIIENQIAEEEVAA